MRMTISVGELFRQCGLETAGVVRWGQRIPVDEPGVYIVSSTPDAEDGRGIISDYRPDFEALAQLRVACPNILVDGVPATERDIANRLTKFWIPNTAALYIGRATTSLRSRVSAYYSTKIGHTSPHAGGWWLKTLVDVDELFVHYATADAPISSEALLLKNFAAAVPPSVRRTVHDPERIAPFANVEVKPRVYKRHGMAGYKIQRADAESSLKPTARAEFLPAPDRGRSPARPTSAGQVGSSKGTRIESQVITDRDRAGSNLRIPARSSSRCRQ